MGVTQLYSHSPALRTPDLRTAFFRPGMNRRTVDRLVLCLERRASCGFRLAQLRVSYIGDSDIMKRAEVDLEKRILKLDVHENVRP
jgi:hypothetical protein